MKKLLSISIMALALVMAACSDKGGECRVHGTVTNPNLEDKCIYLIALDATVRDSVGIDSAFIKDGKFEITTRKNMMAILRMDYHYRVGVQELLVVEEPGDLYVTIDSVSSCRGTKNNDQLQAWKEETEILHSKAATMAAYKRQAMTAGDTLTVKKLEANISEVFAKYKETTLSRADKLDNGPLKDFFYSKYGIRPDGRK